MNSLMYCNIANGELQTSLTGGTYTIPNLTAGDTILLKLRTFAIVNGTAIEQDLTLAGARLSLSNANSTPTGGFFSLTLNGDTTATMPYDVDQNVFETELKKINPLVKVSYKSGGYLVEIENGNQANDSITIAQSRLTPESFFRPSIYTIGTTLFQHIRFITTPLAFTDSFSLKLPPRPQVYAVRDGAYDNVTGIGQNEIQELYIPAEFRGTFALKRGNAESPILNTQDGITEIQDALNTIAQAGGNFSVSNPDSYRAQIEFKGSMGYSDQPLLQAVAKSAPQGDISLFLGLSSLQLKDALNTAKDESKGFIEAELQLEVDIVDDADQPNVHRPYTLFRKDVRVYNDGVWNALTTQQRIDWTIPPEPRSYIPFSRDQIITGSQHYVGTLFVPDQQNPQTTYQVNHNLETDAIHLTLRENKSNGKVLLNGTDYTATIVSDNVVEIQLDEAVDNDEVAVVVTSAGPNSAFLAHTHNANDIQGLQEFLDTIDDRVSELETILPQAERVAVRTTKTAFTAIPPIAVGVYGISEKKSDGTLFDYPALFNTGTGFKNTEAVKITKPIAMLRAIHDAVVSPLTTTILSNPKTNIGVFRNETTSTITLPSAHWVKGQKLLPNELGASDGTNWYQVYNKTGTSSYYPSAYVRTLWSFACNTDILAVNRLLKAMFSVQTQGYNANALAQCFLVVEAGEYNPSSLSGLGPNLENVNYNTTILEQKLFFANTPNIGVFGVRIGRDLFSIFGDKNVYGIWQGVGNNKPANGNFAIRAVLKYFDCEDIAKPTGLLGYRLLPEIGEGQEAPSGETMKIEILTES